MVKSLITCTCQGLAAGDLAPLSEATGLAVEHRQSALCGGDHDLALEAQQDGETLVACTAEARRFASSGGAEDCDAVPLLDLRDRATWTRDTRPALPKIAALVAEAQLPAPGEKTVDVVSEGVCLVVGPAEVALNAAAALAPYLTVTVLLEAPDDGADTDDFDVVVGRIRTASGALGQFSLTLDGFRQPLRAARGPIAFTDPRNGARSECDIILDLRGGTPLFPAPDKREGYLRADPAHPQGVGAAILAASHLMGTFEKPLYVQTEAALCAHSRAGQTGCTRCLDLCPTGAITPAGDFVTVDPMVCAGCGACSAACPSGAIRYDAPPVASLMVRVQTLARAYRAAGGAAPRLLVHDAHGAEMIRLAARHAGGLPADVIPLELPAMGAFGHAEALAALAAGFATVTWLPGPKVDRAALDAQIALTAAIAGAETVSLLDTPDPEAMSDGLFDGPVPASVATPVRPMGTRRQVARQAARALRPDAATLPLPAGAPYGAIAVDTEACTLCQSCVSLCPSGALGDNPDRPQIRFQEDACLQCGLCSHICPENAITLVPQLDLTDAALNQTVLHEEEPFCCIACGVPFGVKSTIEKITAKLEGHAMFAGSDQLAMVQMCDTCRVEAQYHSADSPLRGADKPRPRTTDDYFSARRDH